MGAGADDRTGEADLSGFLRGGKLYGFPAADPAEDGNCGEDTELSIKANDFLQRIDHYRNLTPYTSIRDLLQRILDDHDYLNYVTALPAGSTRRATVEMLLTKASAFEKTSYFGLFHFIRYMEQLE